MKKEILELREKMAREGIDVYFVPSGDDHSSEYVNDHFKAREFMSGLSGESGELIVDDDGAYLWTDGRYFLQAESQLKGSDIELMRMAEPGVPTVEEFLEDLAKKKDGYVLGFDGRIVSSDRGKALENQLGKLGVTFKYDKDLVGEIWKERPAINPSVLFELPIEYTGKSAAEKLSWLRGEMDKNDADYLLVSDLMECAWLLNLRGHDVAYTPVFFGYALVGKDDLKLFVMDGAVIDKLPGDLDFITLEKYDDIEKSLAALPAGKKLWLDESTTNYEVYLSVPEDVDIIAKGTPIAMEKALKNDAEIKGFINAHIKDGVAMVKFIYWLKNTVGKRKITELDAAEYLKNCRMEQEGCFDLSFETISGYGPNGAIIHYAPTPETDAEIKPDGFLLMDSGGQYMDGTTDITRTIAVGPLTQEMIDDYTYVLKSHIAMATAELSPDQNGIDIDRIARQPLRDANRDFKHGLSHGVGHVLSCHEGPNILRRVPTPVPIKPRMIMSNEPGYYVDHKYGVRIENLVLLEKNDKGNTTFRSITYCPYEPEAINKKLLTDDEIKWINDYNVEVREKLLPLLDGELAEFLKSQTEEL